MRCRHHPSCPGCPLLDDPYEQQLVTKRERLRDAFSYFHHLPDPPEVIGSEWPEAYRHRLKLPIGRSSTGRLSVGLYARGAQRRVLHTPDCPVLAPQLREAILPILDWIEGRDGVHSMDLRVSDATGELQLVLACVGGDLHGGKRAARELVRTVPNLASVAVSEADRGRKKVMGARPRIIAGHRTIEEAIGETRYDLLPGSFFQTDPRQAARMHSIVREFVGGADRVLDLYSGVGAYALMLAPHVGEVVAVELVRQAAESARRRAPDNVKVIAAPVEEARLEGDFDVTVLNPARRGSDPTTLQRIAEHSQRLVYISCGPETLARDLDCLAAHGMRIARMQPIDLFPQTREVETVVLLERGEPLVEWSVGDGRARGPWLGRPSGAVGRPDEITALLIGDTGQYGRFQGGSFERIRPIASHSLVKIKLEAPLERVMAAMARKGHPAAGAHERTNRFFAEKAGLVRPFVHVSRAGAHIVPMHGDLRLALDKLGGGKRISKPPTKRDSRPPRKNKPDKRERKGRRTVRPPKKGGKRR